MFPYLRYVCQDKNNKTSAPEVRKTVVCLSRDMIVAVSKNRCLKLADINM